MGLKTFLNIYMEIKIYYGKVKVWNRRELFIVA